MVSLMSSSSSACQRAAQLFVTILVILVIGKSLTWVPVMSQLDVAGTFKAADIVWFIARLAALVVFYFFAGYLIDALPDSSGIMAFARGVAEPLTALLIVINVQALFWEVLAPFLDALGRTVYFSAAIALIVGVGIWLVLRANHHAAYLVDSVAKCIGFVSGLFPRLKPLCPQCKAEIAQGANFCDNCGHRVLQGLRCGACGEMVADGQKFCHGCGAVIDKPADSVAASSE